MNYYRNDNYSNDDDIDNNAFNRESMLGNIPNPDLTTTEVNLELDQEVNEWLKEIVDEELAPDDTEKELKGDDPLNDSLDPKKEQYQDYYDDFPEQDQEPIPEWYDEMLQKKIQETKKRLQKLSDFVCYASAATGYQIKRIENDHNTFFCKLDVPRHPPLSEPWQNYWRFNCVKKCKEDPDPPPYHAHTADCELLLMEHVGTGVTTRSENILPCEFPKHVMDTVELFQIFAKESSKVNLNDEEIPDTVFEKPNWQYIKIRSNFKGEIMLIACGKGISPALSDLKKFFYSGPGRACNVVSLYCINIKWSQKKSIFPPTFLTGCLELRDKVGPITIQYNPKTNINFNSAEAVELGKIMLEYLEPTLETTVVDIGCNIGALSLMLAQKSDKVVGLNTLDHEIKAAEQLKQLNNICNALFICCSPKEVQTKISTHVRKCISVATVNLNSPFGKTKDCSDVMLALRELPTICKIVVYGSISYENRKCIEKLTTASNDSEFLPMRGCILDKSPSIQNLFDIVILFQRKSLIEPKIGLTASVNVKSDSSVSEASIENLSIKSEFNPKFTGFKPFLKGGRPSKKFGRFDSPMLPIEKDVKPKLPPPPKEILDFTAPPPPLPPLPLLVKPFSSFETDNSYSSKEKFHRPSIIDMLNVKELKKKFDSPSLPISPPKNTNANLRNQEINLNDSEQSTDLGKNSATSLPPWHKPVEMQRVVQPEGSTGSGFLRVKQEQELKCSSQLESLNEPIHPALQGQNNLHLQNPAIKNEIQFDFSHLPIKKEESIISISTEEKPVFVKTSSPVEREEGELSDSGDNSIFLDAIIKPEPMDLDDDDDESDCSSMKIYEVKKEVAENNFASSLTCIKNEPIDFNEFTIRPIKSESTYVNEDRESIKSTNSNTLPVKTDPESTNSKELHADPQVENKFFWHSNSSGLPINPEFGSAALNVNVKSEPIDDIQSLEEVSENTSSAEVTVKSEILSSLPDIDDIENMETPIHNPAALTRQFSPSPPPTTSTFDGYQFSVKPNMSFLTLSKEAEKQSVKVKEEKVEPENDQNVRNQEDDEIKIIGVKGEVKYDKVRKNIKQERRISIKSEISNEINMDDKNNDDLRILLEQRQKLQKQLDSEKSKRRFQRSPSFSRRSPLRRGRSPYSPGEWRSKSRYSPDIVRRRNRSPESPKWSRGYRSPSFDRYRGKRYRSPSSPNRRSYKRNQSPDSSDRFYKKRYQSSDLLDSPPFKKRYQSSDLLDSPPSKKRYQSSDLLDSPPSKKRNQSPDIYERLYGRKRSSESPERPWSRKNRTFESPERPWSRKNRTPESPERPWNRKNRSSESPDRSRYRKPRSPVSPDKPQLKENKSPPSFERNWRYRNKSPPEVVKSYDKKYNSHSSSKRNSRSKSRSSSPIVKRRQRSPSLSLSPHSKQLKTNKSPVGNHADNSPSPSRSDKQGLDSKKKKKKKKKSSKSKSPHRSESEKKEKRKNSDRKSVNKLKDQLHAGSSEGSPKHLKNLLPEVLPNEIPLPTAIT